MKYKLHMESLFHSIGFIIGAVVGVPLVFLLISKIFFQPGNSINEEHIQQYMNESIQIQVQMPVYGSDLYTENFGSKTIIHFLSRYGKGKRKVFYLTFYNEEFKKYFTIWFFNPSGFYFIRDRLWDGNTVYLTVNSYEMNSLLYGTIENPIPILKVIGVDKPIRYKALDHDLEYMKENYYTNVKLYLEYEMPRDEFKQRFNK